VILARAVYLDSAGVLFKWHRGCCRRPRAVEPGMRAPVAVRKASLREDTVEFAIGFQAAVNVQPTMRPRPWCSEAKASWR